MMIKTLVRFKEDDDEVFSSVVVIPAGGGGGYSEQSLVKKEVESLTGIASHSEMMQDGFKIVR